MSAPNPLGFNSVPRVAPHHQRIEHVLVQRPLQRVLAFTRRSIHDVINDPIARREVLGYYKLYRWVERGSEVSDLERQWNFLPQTTTGDVGRTIDMSDLWIERSLFLAYLLLGPICWAVFLFGMFKGRQRLSLLRRPLFDLPATPPRASVLIPIKDEAHQIRECLKSVLALDYPDLQIIAIDDRSTDGTGQILDEIASRDPRLQVIHIKPNELPAGWVGKPHALHVGVQHATGDWLLFVDSDMQLAPDSLRATIALALMRRYGLVSLLPRLVNETFWERLIVPLGAAATSVMFLLPMCNYNELPCIAFANGQFMLIRRRAYVAIGGHEPVRDQLSEDIGIARALKCRGYKPRLAIGSDFASTRMYNSFASVMQGWSRNFFGGSGGHPWRMLAGILFVLTSCFSLFGAIPWGAYRIANPITEFGGEAWLLVASAHWLIMTIAIAINYAWTGNPKRYALLFPLGGLMLIVIWCRAIAMCFTRRVEWRGTRYANQFRSDEPAHL